ncbi:MAG: hypothetical protein ACM3JB_21550 [Acidobacteriaceae bacterium]
MSLVFVLLTIALTALALFLFYGIRLALKVRTLRRALDPKNPDPVAREKVFRDVARRAGDRVPDEIHMEPATMVLWKDQDKWREAYNRLEERGFRHAGNYRVVEIGVDVQFLINDQERALACIYNHPAAGVFMDIVTRYEDGSCVTFANRAASGLDQHPQLQNRFLGDVSPAELIERTLADRPQKPMREICEKELVPDFCRVWKEYKEWRNKRGTTAEEVERIYERLHESQQKTKETSAGGN